MIRRKCELVHTCSVYRERKVNELAVVLVLIGEIMDLQALVAIAEEGPWCGNRPPGQPRLHPSLEASWSLFGSRPELRRHQANLSSQEIFGPEPDPWRLGAIEVGLYGAIALYQLGKRLSGEAAKGIRSAALA